MGGDGNPGRKEVLSIADGRSKAEGIERVSPCAPVLPRRAVHTREAVSEAEDDDGRCIPDASEEEVERHGKADRRSEADPEPKPPDLVQRERLPVASPISHSATVGAR